MLPYQSTLKAYAEDFRLDADALDNVLAPMAGEFPGFLNLAQEFTLDAIVLAQAGGLQPIQAIVKTHELYRASRKLPPDIADQAPIFTALGTYRNTARCYGGKELEQLIIQVFSERCSDEFRAKYGKDFTAVPDSVQKTVIDSVREDLHAAGIYPDSASRNDIRGVLSSPKTTVWFSLSKEKSLKT